MTVAALVHTHYKDGSQAWPNDTKAAPHWPADGTPIGIPAHCWMVEVGQHPITKDSAIQIMTGEIEDDMALFIPRGGSVVIEAI